MAKQSKHSVHICTVLLLLDTHQDRQHTIHLALDADVADYCVTYTGFNSLIPKCHNVGKLCELVAFIGNLGAGTTRCLSVAGTSPVRQPQHHQTSALNRTDPFIASCLYVRPAIPRRCRHCRFRTTTGWSRTTGCECMGGQPCCREWNPHLPGTAAHFAFM